MSAMRRILLIALAVLVLGGVAASRWAFSRLSSVASEPVAGDVHMLTGLGGNVGVLVTGEGAVVVDSMTFGAQGEAIIDAASALAGQPVAALVNTHYHGDHAGGNPAFAADLPIVSTGRTLSHLRYFEGERFSGEAAERLPDVTFEKEHVLEVGGKTIRLLHLGRGHTDGDLVVLFEDDRVLHTGDLFFNKHYPNIDLEGGGSIPEWIATLDRVVALDFDRVIPGHGEISDRAGLLGFRAFLRELWSIGQEAAREGLSLEETLEVADLGSAWDYVPIRVPFILNLDRDFVITRSWEQATGSVSPLNPPKP